MNFQIDVTAVTPKKPEPPTGGSAQQPEMVELLRQMLEVQREQLAHQRAASAAHDMPARWRAYLARWQGEFPDLADNCRRILPALERAYGQMITDLTDKLSEDDALDNEFALSEFLDRFGVRLAHLGMILNLVGPLAEAGGTPGGAPSGPPA